MARFFAVILIAFMVMPLSADSQQPNARIDSLESLLAVSQDTVSIKLYNELAMAWRHVDPSKSMEYAAMAIDLSMKLEDYGFLVRSYTTLAIIERNNHQIAKSLEDFRTAYIIASTHELPGLEGSSCNNMARMMLELNLLDSAQYYIDQAEYISVMDSNEHNMTYTYLNRGVLLYKMGKHQQAIELLEKSYRLRHDSLKIKVDFLAPMSHLADIYIDLQDYAMAKDCLFMCLQNRGFQNWVDFQSKIWSRLTTIYYRTRDLDSAEIAARIAISKSMECGSKARLEFGYRMLDSIYIANGDYEKAANICEEYIFLADTVQNNLLIKELNNIQYNLDYMHNERDLADSKLRRKVVLFILAIILLATVVMLPGIIKIARSNRHIKKLNNQLSINQTNLVMGLTKAHELQKAIQPVPNELGNVFLEAFVLYLPRDIVSGDFFWKYSDKRYELIAVADCTGHGMPGAMLTMLGISILDEIAVTGERSSAAILELLRCRIKELMTTNRLNKMQDGMDISLMVIDRQTLMLDFAGAYNSLVYIRNGQLNTLKATRCPIGEYVVEKPFMAQQLQLQMGDCIYLMSDGYWSQFGGPDGKKISQAHFMELLSIVHLKTMMEQESFLQEYFRAWQGNSEQVDDVTVAGFRV